MAKFLEPVEKNTHIQHFSFIILFLFIFINGFAQPIFTPPQTNRTVKKYFVSKLGNDANNGLTAGTSWQTLNRVNRQRLFSGDSVVFNGGDTILGSLNLNSQKNSQFNNIDVSLVLPISFNSYGTGKATLKCADTLSYVVNITYLAKTKITFKNLNFLGIYDAVSYSGGNSSIGYGIVIDNYTKNYYVDKNGVNIYPGTGGLFSVDSCRFSRFKTAGIGLIVVSPLKQGVTFNITSNDFDSIGFTGIYGVGIYSCNINITNNSITNIIGKNSTDNYSSAGIFFNRVNNASIQYNYINKIGMNNLQSFGGIYIAGSSNCEVRRNEIKNVRNKTGTDGAGVYFNCQSDSNSAEFNFIANCETGIILSNATNNSCPDWHTPEDEFIQSSYNVAAYNIIMMDSGATTGISLYNYPYRSIYTRYDGKFPKRNFIYNNLFYIKRSKDIGQLNMDDTAYFTCGIRQFGYNDSTYIYNNILYLKDSTQAISTALTHSSDISDSITDQWGNLFTNSKILNNNYYFENGDSTYRFSEQLGTTGPAPNYYPLSRKFLYPMYWSDSTNSEKDVDCLYSYYNTDPGIKNITQDLSNKINPYKFDTLTCFQITDIYSNALGNGTNFNTDIQKIANILLFDIYGNAIIEQPSLGIHQGYIRSRHYYVSSAGDDNNSGLLTTRSFKTLTKVNSTNLHFGDTVSFKGGDIIYGQYDKTIVLKNDSSKIVFNSYGTGKSTIEAIAGQDIIFHLRYSKQIKYEFKNLIFKGNYDAYNRGGDTLNNYGIFFNNDDRTISAECNNFYFNVDSCEFTGFKHTGLTIGNDNYYMRGYFRIQNNNFHDIGVCGFASDNIYYSDFKVTKNLFTNIYGKWGGTTTHSANRYNLYSYATYITHTRGLIIDSNYVNNIGDYSAGCGLYISGSKSVKFQYNEVRNVKTQTGVEGVGLYQDCGSDSILFERNFVQNCYGGISLAGGGTLISGYNPAYFPDGVTEDSIGSNNNIARYNIIVLDSSSHFAAFLYSTDPKYIYGDYSHATRNNMFYNNLVYAGIVGTPDTADGRVYPSGITSFGGHDSLYVYNNIFILDSGRAFRLEPIYKSEHGQTITAFIHNNIYWDVDGTQDKIISQWKKSGWTLTTFFHWFDKTFSSLTEWADSTGYEKNGMSYTFINTNPNIKNIMARIYGTSARIGLLDTLNNFKPLPGSVAFNNGTNYNDIVRYLGHDTATYDFFGNTIDATDDIGIYSSP